MAAALVLSGTKRSFFEEDLPPCQTPPYLSKRHRCSSPPSSSADESTLHHFWVPYLLSQLRSLFPNLDPQVLESSLQQSGYDLDATVNILNVDLHAEQQKNFLRDEWIDLAIGEMTCATSVGDARARAAKILGSFEKSTRARVSEEIAESNVMLKKEKEAMVKENVVLKRFVNAQREKCEEYERREEELKKVKELVEEKKEQLRKMEMDNYGLQLELEAALKRTTHDLMSTLDVSTPMSFKGFVNQIG